MSGDAVSLAHLTHTDAPCNARTRHFDGDARVVDSHVTAG